MAEERLTRIAIVEADRCKPKKCRQECSRNCPVNRMGKKCIIVQPTDKISWISEELCIGCGICVKKCPFEAITIINLPKDLEKETTHRYGPNSFKLHRLPTPRPGQVLGLVGTNGIGKSTALKVLAGKLKPNLGNYAEPPSWDAVLRHFRGNELQNFFTKVLEDDIKAVIKPQYVDHIPKAIQGLVSEHLQKHDERDVKDSIIAELDLESVLSRQIEHLSGGELQRFAIGIVCVSDKDIYMFDEPSSYLDVRQRLRAARSIRALCNEVDKYVVVVEHDLSVLDYLSDYICVLYGKPGAYGVVTMPFSVREGINIFLAGFVPTENLRFREVELTFKVSENVQELYGTEAKHNKFKYPAMKTTLGDFKLHVEAGSFTNSEIIVMLGQNGTGKTTFIRMLAGLLKPDGDSETMPALNVSFKPQKISPSFKGTVRQLLHSKIQSTYTHPQFISDVIKPLRIEDLYDQQVLTLSGGELQRVAITLALGKPADIYLIDEPSAYLDSEQRLVCSKVLKRFILHAKKTAFIVEHDFIMATYLADRVIVYTGEPAKECTAHSPQSLLTGMNAFLRDLEITFRRDPTNLRPRINKMHSVKDQEQKKAGNYFFLETDEDEEDEKGAAGKAARKAAKKDKAAASGDAAAASGSAAATPASGSGAAAAAKPKKKKAASAAADDSKADAFDNIDDDAVASAKKKKKKKDDGDDDSKSDEPAAAAAPASGKKKKAAAAGADAAAPKKKKPASAAAPADDDDDDAGSDEDAAPAAAAPKKKKKKADAQDDS